MRSLMREMPYLAPTRRRRPKEPMKEGPRRLRDSELGPVFRSLFKMTHQEKLARFLAARDALREDGVSVDVVRETHGRLSLALRLEVPTYDGTMDERLYRRVTGMGFKLSLESRLVERAPDVDDILCLGTVTEGRLDYMARTYVVTEGSPGMQYACSAVEGLLKVKSMFVGRVTGPRGTEAVPLPERAAEPAAAESSGADQLVAMQR